ncbi:phosphate uptake regulator PhoU [Rhodococcus sp. NPDC056960]|uniref:phosphate signaling complex PhoU family protein n=1 Tax=Rhodococcus sp. NPDC056960 TaxID=3345982 RepID=UPI003641EAB0
MRTKFHDQLDTLFDQLTTMRRLAGDAITTATDAFGAADLTAAEKVFAVTERIGAVRGPCEDQAMALLALQAPVARDLRQVVTGVFLVSDLSRMGGLAEHIAESVRRRHPHPVAHGRTQHLSHPDGTPRLRTRHRRLALALDVTDNRLDDLHRDLPGLAPILRIPLRRSHRCSGPRQPNISDPPDGGSHVRFRRRILPLFSACQ